LINGATTLFNDGYSPADVKTFVEEANRRAMLASYIVKGDEYYKIGDNNPLFTEEIFSKAYMSLQKPSILSINYK
jgi:hypothetical protein